MSVMEEEPRRTRRSFADEFKPQSAGSSTPAGATDVALPIIDLGEDHTWRPAETPQFGTIWINLRHAVATIGGALTGLLAWKLAQAVMTAARRYSRRLVTRLV